MRRVLLAILALVALPACSRERVVRCEVEVTRTIAFTTADAEDTITTTAFGPSCDKAIGLFMLRDPEGHPVWAWTSPLPRAFGAAFAAEDEDAMRAFLERWADPTVASTLAAPAWTELSLGQTTLERATYEDIRARELPMLCHFIGTGRQACVFWEPAAGGAGHFFDRDLEDEQQ